MEETNDKRETTEKHKYEPLKQYHKYDISDGAWDVIAPCLSGQPGQWGRVANDNRRFLDAVFWVLRTGEPWRSLPPEYGKWGTAHQRYRRWRQSGMWDNLLEILVAAPDFAWPHHMGEDGKKQDKES